MKRDSGRRKSKIYGNYVVLSPEGEFMFRSTHKRAKWYLDRGLADLVSETPPAIKFNFKPKGGGHVGDLYYLTEKKNKCVVCGEEDLGVLTRHHIVPIDYRKFLPETVKARNSHDIVAICRDCHDVYEQKYALELRMELALRYNAPVLPKETQYPELIAIGLAFCLVNYGHKIPANNIKEMRGRMRDVLGVKRISQKMIDELSKKDLKEERKKYPTHAEIVVSKLENIQEFVEMWRLHFVKTMQPKFMPKHWNVKRTIYRKNSI